MLLQLKREEYIYIVEYVLRIYNIPVSVIVQTANEILPWKLFFQLSNYVTVIFIFILINI